MCNFKRTKLISHTFINIFSFLNDKYFIQSIIFLFIMIALLAHALKIFPLIIVFLSRIQD